MSLIQMDLNNKVMPEAEFRKKMLERGIEFFIYQY